MMERSRLRPYDAFHPARQRTSAKPNHVLGSLHEPTQATRRQRRTRFCASFFWPAAQPTSEGLHHPWGANQVPLFVGLATMMRLPSFDDPAALDVGFVGVPLDLGKSHRSG